MKKELSQEVVKSLIKDAEFSFRHEDCESCECYLGYIVQLQIDSDPEASDFLESYKSARGEIHSCLGCDPCSPGILYADYLRKNASRLE